MKIPAILTGLFAAVFLLAPAHAQQQRRADHVFVISIDQGNPEAIQRLDLPNLHAMTEQGAHTWEAYTIVPSITLPSHVSMLTGVGIQKHQVDWNDYEKNRPPLGVPTVFSLAKERGLVTGMFVSKEKFKHLLLPDTVDKFVWPTPDNDALAVAKAFAADVAGLKPNLCFIHFRDPDSEGHAHGVKSPEKNAAMAKVDEALGIVKKAISDAGIADRSVLLVTADHGSHDVKNAEGQTRGSHGSSKPDDVLIPWIAIGKGVKPGFTITQSVVIYDTSATALWLLGVPLPEHFWGRPVTSAFQ